STPRAGPWSCWLDSTRLPRERSREPPSPQAGLGGRTGPEEGACRDSEHRGVGLHVPEDDRAGADHRPLPDDQGTAGLAVDDDGPRPDEGAPAHLDPPRDVTSG